MRLIAIVGMTGSGKSELARIFEERGFRTIRFGAVTDDILRQRGLPLTEENEKRLRESLRKEHGMEAYAKLNLPRIEAAIQKNDVMIDGLYSWEESLFLNGRFGRKLVVLAAYAPPGIRYERLSGRKVRPLTIEQARARDRGEIEHLNKAAPIAMADYTIRNVGTLSELRDEVDEFLEWMKEMEAREHNGKADMG
jgi:dephospho-CoA kinase